MSQPPARPLRRNAWIRHLQAPASLLLWAGLALASCAPSGEPRRTPGEQPALVRVGALPNLTHAPALIGLNAGIFEAALRPSTVQWRFFNAGPEVIESLFANELDIAYLGPGPALNGYLRSGGRALRIAGGVATGGAALVVRGDVAWSDPADLAGRRIATPGHGNTQDQALRWWMRTNGQKSVHEGGSVAVMPLPNAEQINLFRSRQLDGAWSVEPWVSRLVYEAGGRVLMPEEALWPGGRYATTVLVVRSAFAAAHPALVERWLAAQDRVMALIVAEPDSARRTVNRELARLNGRPLPDSVLASAWSRIQFGTELPIEAILEGGRRARALGFLAVDPPPAESLLAFPRARGEGGAGAR